MNLKFKKCDFIKIASKVEKNIEKNNIVVDSFWEDHLLGSNHYLIEIDGKEEGYFSIFEKQLLMLFYIEKEFRNESQEIFAKIKKYEELNSAFVPTGDELLLSHVLDNYTKLEKQAYFSEDSKREISKDLIDGEIEMVKAKISDSEMIIKYSGEFFDNLEKRIGNNEIFIFYKKSEVLGFGIIDYGRVAKKYASVGMIVRDELRGNGIGRNIIYGLKNYVYDKGLIPISGCWYFNHNSKKTVGSAGFYSKTRLLKVYF